MTGRSLRIINTVHRDVFGQTSGARMENDGSGIDHQIRVISVYATKWRFTGDPDPTIEHLKLGQLEEFYALYKDQLPQIIRRTHYGPDQVFFQPTPEEAEKWEGEGEAPWIPPQDDEVTVLSMDAWLFVLPSDQVVAAYDFDLAGRTVHDEKNQEAVDPLSTIRLLERCAYARLIINNLSVDAHIASLLEGDDKAKQVRMIETDDEAPAATPAGEPEAAEPFPPERHQIVFATNIKAPPLSPPRQTDGDDDNTIRQILYRIEPPNRPEFITYERPPELNLRGTLCAVTPYVSLLSDHPDYLENSVFLTVVQAVGTAARFRQIWHKAHREVRRFRREDQDEKTGTQSRDKLEKLADELGNLELDLSFSVETSADLGLLIPSLRIESFHHKLYEVLELRERAETVSRMFGRLEASIRSELTAIDIRDRRLLDAERQREEDRRQREEDRRKREEDRRRQWDNSVAVVTFIAIPIGFLSAFYGLNVREVDPSRSGFSTYYWPVWAIAFGLTAIPIFVWRRLRRNAKRYGEDSSDADHRS